MRRDDYVSGIFSLINFVELLIWDIAFRICMQPDSCILLTCSSVVKQLIRKFDIIASGQASWNNLANVCSDYQTYFYLGCCWFRQSSSFRILRYALSVFVSFELLNFTHIILIWKFLIFSYNTEIYSWSEHFGLALVFFYEVSKF